VQDWQFSVGFQRHVKLSNRIVSYVHCTPQTESRLNLLLVEYKFCERLRAMSIDAEKLFANRTTSQKVAATAVERVDVVAT